MSGLATFCRHRRFADTDVLPNILEYNILGKTSVSAKRRYKEHVAHTTLVRRSRCLEIMRCSQIKLQSGKIIGLKIAV